MSKYKDLISLLTTATEEDRLPWVKYDDDVYQLTHLKGAVGISRSGDDYYLSRYDLKKEFDLIDSGKDPELEPLLEALLTVVSEHCTVEDSPVDEIDFSVGDVARKRE